uniref:D-isomer specific 2-hydroxyacid dehydrogenase NAD-binding domain-containing protein n=1 Tax=Chrysotila carterae TaxID=13221 RepID=A0A6S9W3Q0_CHRCT
MPLTVLATLPLPAQHEAELRELNAEVSTLQFDGIIENELPSWNAAMITSAAFRLPDSGAALYEQLADLVRRGRVEWVHFCAAGMDGQMFIPLIRAAHAAGIKMTYCPGVYATPIAQYVIAHVLSCTRMLREHAEQQASKTWAPLMQRDPRGAVVGVVGAGGIGNEVARMATALGMRSIGWRRRAGSFGSFEDIFTGEEGLDALLMESDFVVVAVPNTPQTRKERPLGRTLGNSGCTITFSSNSPAPSTSPAMSSMKEFSTATLIQFV